MEENNINEEEKVNIDSMESKTDSLEEAKHPMSKKKIILLVLVLLLCTVVTMTIIFNLNDIGKTFEQLTHVEGYNMLLATACLVIYLLSWPLPLCLLARVNKTKASFWDSYLIGGTEHFFNGVTPFSTGGQPVQVYLYTKRGVSPSQSTGTIAANFTAYLIASNLFAIVALFFYGTFSENFNQATSWMIILGFVMNLFTLVFIILMSTCKFIRDFFVKILKVVCKWKFIGKYLEKAIPAFEDYCANAQAAAKEAFSHPLAFIGAILIRVITLAFYYAMPFFILKALYVDILWDVLPLIVLASSFAITTMVWVPTPGGTGGIEFAFTMIFSITIFGGIKAQEASASAMILWRFLTYYLLMVLSFVMYIIYNAIAKRKRENI